MSYQPRHSRAVISFFLGLTVSMAGAAPSMAQKADPTVYGALPSVSEAAISPDGKTIAVLQNAGDATGLMFYDLDNPDAAPKGVGLGETDARDIVWANDDRVFLLASQSSQVSTLSGIDTIEFFRWLTVSKSKEKAKILLGNEPGFFVANAGDLLSVMPNDPKKAVFARHSSSGKRTTSGGPSRLKDNTVQPFVYSLFLVDAENGSQKRLETGDEYTIDWIVNADGEAVMRIDIDPATGGKKVYYRKDPKARFELMDQNIWNFDFYSQADKPDTFFAGAAANNKAAVFEVNLANGDRSIVYSNPTYDVADMIYDPRKAKVTGARYVGDLSRSYHFDETQRTTQDSLRNAIPGSEPMIISKSADGTRMVVKVLYTDHPPQFYLYDKTAGTLNMIAASYPELDGKIVAKKEKYDYTSPDGLTIHGYLTVPAGGSKENAPLIVLPHGGPESRADQEFDYQSFFYAARGYTVYEPNFRGSEGYGVSFRTAGYGEWGRKMQDDISNGVKKLISDGIADSDRICIVGSSYGGYAALAGATLTPELYACAVSINGISNLPGMLGDVARDSSLGEQYWTTRIGSRYRDNDQLTAVSPASNAETAGAPILLIVSKDDVVVPQWQSTQMRDALKQNGKPYEIVELPGEDHWLSTSTARTEMLQRSIEFIDKHIGQ